MITYWECICNCKRKKKTAPLQIHRNRTSATVIDMKFQYAYIEEWEVQKYKYTAYYCDGDKEPNPLAPFPWHKKKNTSLDTVTLP